MRLTTVAFVLVVIPVPGTSSQLSGDIFNKSCGQIQLEQLTYSQYVVDVNAVGG